MKKTIGLIAICLAIATTFPVFAQQPAASPQQPAASPQQPAAAAPQDPQCTPENKLAWYNEFRKEFKGDTAKANELAKKWLACPAVPAEEQQATYLKTFVSLYEKANRKDQIADLVYKKKDYTKAFEVGKAVLAEEPENLKVLLDLAYAGFAAALENKTNFAADAIAYSKKAMQMIEAGKAPEKWDPYLGKEDALAFLNNYIGRLTVQTDPAAALPNLINVAQHESKLKKLPSTYGIIAAAYEAGPYAKMSADYKTVFGGKDETPESKLALENINQVVDRMIDAYARAVSLAGTDAANQASKTAWMENLGTWYKYRHQSDAGLNEMIAGILAKPLPPFPTPITALPAATPTSTPTSGSASATGSSAVAPGTAPTTQPATTSPATTNPAPAKTPTPAATPKPNAPAKTTTTPPKPRRNHRGR